MKRLLGLGGVLVALTLGAGQASAQSTGTARGKVLDDKGKGVPEATVTIEYLGGVTRKLDVRTNKKGDYTQVGLAPGRYKVTASKDGFQGSYIEVRISLGEPTYLPDIQLAPRAAGTVPPAEGQQLQADFKAAAELMAAGKHAEAEAAFKALLAKNPTIPELHYNLGLLAGMRKDWPAAEAAYLKAVEIKPDYSIAYTALSNVYLNTNQPDKAAAMAGKATGSAGTDPKALFQVAFVAFNGGKYEEAAEAFKKAEAADPTNAEIQYYLGSIALTMNKVDECITRLDKYVATAPAAAENLTTAKALLQACKQTKGTK